MADGSGEFSMLDEGTLISGDSIMGEAVSLARLGPGKRVGPYLILARLSVCDRGVRYRAWDTREGAVVVLRLLRPERDQDQLREDLEALAAIQHPGLATTREVELRYGVVCVAQDDIGEVSLDAWSAAEARSWQAVVQAMRPIAGALGAVHAAGHVYRELGPGKVFINTEGTARLAGLRSQRERRTAPGQARPIDASTISRSSSIETLSSPLLLIEGCPAIPAYLSPEQYADQPATSLSDQFGFCVLLYEALYGERPFAGRTIEGLFLHIEEGRLRPPPAGSRVPRWLREVVVRGLAHDPARRWPSMDALVDALDRDPGPRRRMLATGFALVLALAAVFGLGALWAT